jgi:hypothetical protein
MAVEHDGQKEHNDLHARARSSRPPAFFDRHTAHFHTPILQYCCALNTTSPGQSRGRAGASLLTAISDCPGVSTCLRG